MNDNPEIEAIVAAMSAGPSDPKNDIYREVAWKNLHAFEEQMVPLERLVDQLEMLVHSDERKSVGGEHLITDLESKAYELMQPVTRLAAQLALGGNRSYQERVTALDQRLKDIENGQATPKPTTGAGCMGVLILIVSETLFRG